MQNAEQKNYLSEMIKEAGMKRSAKVGIFAVGHDTYWGQFEGLLDKLMEYHEEVKKIVGANNVELIDYGMIDSSIRAYEALKNMKSDGIDILFCDMVTYATSSTFAPIIKDINIPVILLALQPLSALDYSKASTRMQLENDNICSVPEFTCTAERMGKRIEDVIIGVLYGDEQVKTEVARWCGIACVLNSLKGSRIGLMGHVLEAMYDMHCDPAAVSSTFGLHVPLIEIDDAVEMFENVTENEISEKINAINQIFDMPDPKSDPITIKLTEQDLLLAAKSAAALDRLVDKFKLDGLAYYYEGRENTVQRLVSGSFIVGNSLLNAKGIPMCGEFDIKTCIAMLIMERLGIGGSFAEFHPLDFAEDFILVGHDGPHHIAISEGKPVLRSLLKYHGKPGSGASVEFKIKEGPITMLGITQKRNGKFKFVIGEGTSRKGPIPPTGNTNTRGFFEPDTKSFIKAWVMEAPTHHYALGIGHHAKTIKKIGDILGVESVIVKA